MRWSNLFHVPHLPSHCITYMLSYMYTESLVLSSVAFVLYPHVCYPVSSLPRRTHLHCILMCTHRRSHPPPRASYHGIHILLSIVFCVHPSKLFPSPATHS